MPWKIEGDYMETCNCTLLCPCISSNMAAKVFDFVNWSFKKVDSEWMEMTITYRNKLDVPLSWYEIHIEVGDHDFGFKSDVPVLAGGEATSKPQLGMPQEDADMFAPLTPMLCAIGVTDDKGKHTSYY